MNGRRRVLRAVAAIACTCVTAAAAQDPASSLAQAAARDWLALTDAGNGGASWDAAGKLFQGAIKRERWTEALGSVRNPIGALARRSLLSTKFTSSFPGAPDGEYAIVVYRSSFANKADARETVTVAREADGQWRVVGYFIK